LCYIVSMIIETNKITGATKMSESKEIVENPVWEENGMNSILEYPDFYISYNPNMGGMGGFRGFRSDNGAPETALCNSGKFYILNGDFRKDYRQLAIDGGFDKCFTFFKSRKSEKGSSWSN
jgi:hypothetical protein